MAEGDAIDLTDVRLDGTTRRIGDQGERSVDIESFQQRVSAGLGELPSDAQLNAAFESLIREASAMRTLLSLDGDGDTLTDEHLIGLVGNLLLGVAEVACVTAVDLAKAMAWAAAAAEARSAALVVGATDQLVSYRGQP